MTQTIDFIFRLISFRSWNYRHSLQHYTQKLVKDTNGYIKELNTFSVTSPSEQRQIKMQRERLHDEFAATLNRFQIAQRSTAQKEKDQVNKVKEQTFSEPYLGKFMFKVLILKQTFSWHFQFWVKHFKCYTQGWMRMQ